MSSRARFTTTLVSACLAVIGVLPTAALAQSSALVVRPTSLSFVATAGGPNPAGMTILIDGPAGTEWSARPSGRASVVPSSGVTPASAIVMADAAGLAPGSYSETVVVSGANSQITVVVSLQVQAATCRPPVLGSIVPAFGAPGVPVAISGSDLDGTTAVTFGSAAVPFSVTPTRIDTQVPQLPAGPVTVTVRKACGSASTTFTVAEPVQSCVLGVVPQMLQFNATVGATQLLTQTLSLSSLQPGTSFTVQEDSPFVVLGTAFGVTPAQVVVRVDPTGLTAGGYSATLRIACATSGGGGLLTVPLNLSVFPELPGGGEPRIGVSPGSLTFVAPQGTNPPPQNLMLGSGRSQLNFVISNVAASRVQATPSFGRTPQTVSVAVTAADLPPSTYDFTLLVLAPGNSMLPLQVPVRLIVTQPLPSCSVVPSPASLSFTAAAGGPNPPSQTVFLSSPQGQVNFTTAGGPPLVSISPTSGTTPSTLVVSVSTTNLPAGTYSGMALAGCATIGFGGLLPIPVTVTVTSPGGDLRATPSMLAFTGTRGGSNPPAQTLSVTSTGAPLAFSAVASGSFLAVAPSSGTTQANVSVNVNLAGLAEGTYDGAILLSSPGKPSVTVPVRLTVMPPPSLLMVSPTSLTFTTAQDVDPPSRTLTILSSGAPLSWSVSSVGSFLDVGPTSGTTPGSTFIAPRAVGLFPGTYDGSVIVTAPGAGSINVPVTLVVTPSLP